MLALVKNRAANLWFITLVTLVSIRLWSFQPLGEKIFKVLDAAILGFVVLIILFLNRRIRWQRLHFRYNVFLFLLVPLLSAFGAYIYHSQSLPLSFFIIRANFIWLFYLVLHILNVPKKQVINLMLIVGCVWIFLTLVQQFTYPYYYFYTRSGTSGDQSFHRAGVYRYFLLRHQYAVFAIFYFFQQYLNTQKLKNLVYVFIGLLGLYYFGTRQVLAAGLICLAIAIWFAKGKTKLNLIAMAMCAAAALFFLWTALFGQYVEMTTSQIENSTSDLRTLAGNFFLTEYWPSWVCKIIGNGRPSEDSSYGQEINAIKEVFHFFRSDVGIIGGYNEFGIFYVINVLWMNFKGLSARFYDRNSMYLKLFFYNALMLLIISEFYSDPTSIPFYCFLFYLVDKTYEEKLDVQNLELESA